MHFGQNSVWGTGPPLTVTYVKIRHFPKKAKLKVRYTPNCAKFEIHPRPPPTPTPPKAKNRIIVAQNPHVGATSYPQRPRKSNLSGQKLIPRVHNSTTRNIKLTFRGLKWTIRAHIRLPLPKNWLIEARNLLTDAYKCFSEVQNDF